MSFNEAFNIAQNRGLDLVEVSSNVFPAVCKLMDYNKYIFDEKKKQKEQQRIQRLAQVNIKEIQINPVIQDADLKVKIKNIQRLLDEGDKVKVVIKFSGRQLRHTELGKVILEKIIESMPEIVIEKQPVFEGRDLFIILNK